jgi:hypothetical protein
MANGVDADGLSGSDFVGHDRVRVGKREREYRFLIRSADAGQINGCR